MMCSLSQRRFTVLIVLLLAFTTAGLSKSVPHRHKDRDEGSRKIKLLQEPTVKDTGNKLDAGDDEEELWLEDMIDYPVYDYQGDAPEPPNELDNARCPPYPTDAPVRACRARVCKIDKDCKRPNHRCCFNGCRFTCTQEMTYPSVIDWKREPQRRGQSESSWLIKGPNQLDDVEPCTTTKEPDDGDPLLCPHGYMCHIIDPGDPENGVPNRGQCIKEKQNERGTRSKLKILKSELRMSGRCLLWDDTVVRDQTIILLGDQKEKCKCHRGTIHCGDKFVSADVSP